VRTAAALTRQVLVVQQLSRSVVAKPTQPPSDKPFGYDISFTPFTDKD